LKNSLLIRVYSFSYKKSPPLKDPTGNGGGFVFDCRALPNPYWIPELAPLTGFDEAVVTMLDASQETKEFLEASLSMVNSSTRIYREKGYTDLSISFGCTGGKHRSVYCANKISQYLIDSGFDVRTIHWQMEKDNEMYCKKRAMILAAGFGTRLKPMTDKIPKALIQAGDHQMLDWTKQSLQKAGFDEIVVNAHHHAGQIQEWYEDIEISDDSIPLSISYEEEILGTGGGIKAASRWLHGPNPFLVHNVDIWTDFDLNYIYSNHNSEDIATLVCQERQSSSYLLVDDANKVCGLSVKNKDNIVSDYEGDLKKLGFTGIHVCSHHLLEHLSEMDCFSIIDVYLNLIAEGETVRAVTIPGMWFDMGSHEKLEKLRDHLRKSQNV